MFPLSDVAVVNAYGAQAACALVLVGILVHFYSRYRKGYLLEWCGSWFALLMFHGAAAVDLFLLEQLPNIAWPRLLPLLLACPAALVQAFFFYSASYQLAHLRPMRASVRRRAMIGIGSVGVAAALLLATSNDIRVHYFALIGVQSLLFTVALLSGSFVLHRQRRASSFALLLAVSVVYAVLKLSTFLLSIAWLSKPELIAYPLMFGIVELLLQFGLGLAMIISLLEDEREAATLAASEIEHLAYHDGLTGLPNRALFSDRLVIALTHAQRHGSRIALLFIDLDQFKDVNDSLGHSSGDTILRLAALRIRETVRREETVARFGGDEFTVVLYNVEPPQEASRVAQKLLEVIRKPMAVGAREIVVTASIGISMYPGDATDAESLVKNADNAMYRAKERGRDNYQLFAPEMNQRAVEKLELENSLRRAFREKQLEIFYQPLFDLEKGRIYGMEALLRWRHPELGLLQPSRFIPMAESSGLIVPIGAWVIHEACKRARTWQIEQGVDLVISVNISARQFLSPTLLEDIRESLREADLAPHLLEIEITESVAVHDVEHTKELLHEIKRLGVRISIDDFGTGYSSLSYLRDFPVDTLKLDRSFVQDITKPQDSAIASSVIAMAHSLHMKVMAEGVENESQLNFLKENRCDRLQGFFYSVPLSASAFEEFMGGNRWLFERNER